MERRTRLSGVDAPGSWDVGKGQMGLLHHRVLAPGEGVTGTLPRGGGLNNGHAQGVCLPSWDLEPVVSQLWLKAGGSRILISQ